MIGEEKMKAEDLLLFQMKCQNLIKDDDYMEWKSPDNSYLFCIQRMDNQFTYSTMSRYISEVSIKDAVTRIDIIKFHMSEMDVVALVNEFANFIYYLNGPMESSIIRVNNFSNMSVYNMIITRIDLADVEGEPYTDLIVDHYPEEWYDIMNMNTIVFEINEWNRINNSIIPMLKFDMSNSDLSNLIFAFFFTTLIDIDLPEDVNRSLTESFDYLINMGLF